MTTNTLPERNAPAIGQPPAAASENPDPHFVRQAWSPIEHRAARAGAAVDEAVHGLRAVIDVLIDQRDAELAHEHDGGPAPNHLRRDRVGLYFALRALAASAGHGLEHLRGDLQETHNGVTAP